MDCCAIRSAIGASVTSDEPRHILHGCGSVLRVSRGLGGEAVLNLKTLRCVPRCRCVQISRGTRGGKSALAFAAFLPSRANTRFEPPPILLLGHTSAIFSGVLGLVAVDEPGPLVGRVLAQHQHDLVLLDAHLAALAIDARMQRDR